MYFGYNTNGLAHHDLLDAIRLLADLGYQGVGITIDHHALSPRSADLHAQLAAVRRLLEQHGMRSVIETGARFLLDPVHKHEPTLLSAARQRRIDFYKHAIDCAAALGSDCVSLWSGTVRPAQFFDSDTEMARPPESGTCGESPRRGEAVEHLVAGMQEVLAYAAERGVTIGFEPEPGMLIDSMQAFAELLPRIDAPNLGVTLDIGHLQCQGETPIPTVIRHWASRLVNVHLEDMRTGIHEHLMFGEGEIDMPPVLAALSEADYRGGVYVELSRHSHIGPQAARQAMAFLNEHGGGRSPFF